MDDPVGGQVEEPLDVVVVGTGTAAKRRRSRLLLMLVPVVSMLGGVAAVVSLGDPEPDPDALLERAVAALDAAASYHVRLTTVERTTSGDPTGAGADVTLRSVSEIDVVGDDFREDDATAMSFGGTVESSTIRVAGHLYVRMRDLPFGSGNWVELPIDAVDPDDDPTSHTEDLVDLGDFGFDEFAEQERALARLSLLVTGHTGSAPGSHPYELAHVVRDATAPEHVESLPDGGDRLRATLAPPESLADADPRLPTVTVTLDVDSAGRPAAATYRAEEAGVFLDVELRWSNWDVVSPIEAPSDDEIDRTPWVDEDAIRALDPRFLVAPTTVPEGFVLNQLSTDDEYFVGDGDEPCPSLSLEYGPRFDPTAADIDDFEWDYVLLVVVDADCAADEGSYGQTTVTFGDVLVDIDSSLSDEELAAVIGSLAPTTADALLAALADSGWFAYAPTSIMGVDG